MKVAEYFAEFSIRPDRNSIRLVDSELKKLENKLRGFGKNSTIKLKLSGFNVDQPALRLALGNSLDIASKSVAFEISKFVVNDRNLQAALLRAARRLPPLPPGPNPPPVPPHPPGPYPPRPGPYPPDSRRNGMGGGFIGGGLSRVYAPALALGLGGYGLSQLNQRNQQIVSAELGNTAVVGPENGPKSFEWLKKQGNELGFNWLEQAPEFTGFLGSATPLMGYDKSLETYKAFNEFATTRHADPVARKRALKAIQQMAAKGQVNTEELQNQLGDAANFGELPAVFAKAYQESVGGNKTGAKAAQALKDAMKKGQVKTGDVLPIVTRLLAEMAAPTLENSKKSSQSEQGRYQNTVNELATLASDSGVEEGFARIFRTLNAGLSESNGLVRILSEGFNDATKWADDLLLWPQSFVRALEGRDSLVADWLGKDDTEQLRADWKDIKQIFTDISALKFDFLPTLEATSKEIAGILSIVSKLKQLNDNASASADIVQADIAVRGTGPVSDFFSGLAGSFAGVSAYVSTPLDIEESKKYRAYVESNYPRGAQFIKNKEQLEAIQNNFRLQPFDPLSNSQASLGSYNDALSSEFVGLLYPRSSNGFPSLETTPSGTPFKDLPKYDSRSPSEIEDYNKQQALAQADQSSVVNNVTNQFDITISVDATLAGIEVEAQANAMAQAFSTSLTGAFEQAQVNFPTKG